MEQGGRVRRMAVQQQRKIVHPYMLLTTLAVLVKVVLAGRNLFACANSPQSSCTSFFYLTPQPGQSLDDIASLFNVTDKQIFFPASSQSAYMISGDCFCDNRAEHYGFFIDNTNYTVTSSDSSLSQISDSHFGSFAYYTANSSIQVGEEVVLNLMCGCAPSGWAALVSYIVQPGDTLSQITETFQSNQDLIAKLNQITSSSLTIYAQDILYIPIKTDPSTLATGISNPGSPSFTPPGPKAPAKKSSGIGLVVGIIAAVVALTLLATVVVCVLWRKRSKRKEYDSVVAFSGGSHYTEPVSNGSKRSSGSTFSLNFSKCIGKPTRGSVNNNVKRSITLPREAINVFDQEKPVVFNYEEIITATDRFNEAKKVGQGAFGVVYHGVLRKQEVAVKQMKATKSKEFLAELKVLCKVHHTNLVELIGYSAGEESLFLVYEFAENGSLSDRLHKPASRGYPPLSWTSRIQIAVDAARGLEYIHEHTKTHYVHRDVKTSNILLDDSFRAKVADFGLAKLVEQSSDVEHATTKVVGTFGYLAPEYVRDGHATSKSDVYAFGVVLFELITGQEALSRTRSASAGDPKVPDRRSLASMMLNILKDDNPEKKLRALVDENLGEVYPYDCALKTAKLAKACVEDEPSMRPDMKQIVFSLSQTLLTSVEWEASLAGSSQIFSGLVQGR